MKSKEEVIKTLRRCLKLQKGKGSKCSSHCEYYSYVHCRERLMLDAADMLENPQWDESTRLKDIIAGAPSADVLPYEIMADGTLVITVPKGTYEKIGRVLLQEDGTQSGGLFYAD